MENETERKSLVTPVRLTAVLILLAVLAVASWLAFQYRAALGDWARHVTALVREQGPVPFFTALAFLPAVGLPVSAFYLAAGAVFPLSISVTGTALGLAVNITFTYWMARKWFRGLIERLLRRTRYKIPAVAATDHVRLTLFLRLMPGPPFFLQSYLLGLIEVPFTTYFLISWSTQVLIATGFIVLGSAFYSSSLGRALIAVVIVVLVTIIVQWVRRFLARRGGPA
ncbi:MAG: VTT domain-containing protein [Opitutaceae bacterium]